MDSSQHLGGEGTLRSISRTGTQCYEVILVEDLVEGIMGWEGTLRSISGTTQCYEVTLPGGGPGWRNKGFS